MKSTQTELRSRKGFPKKNCRLVQGCQQKDLAKELLSIRSYAENGELILLTMSEAEGAALELASGTVVPGSGVFIQESLCL